MMPLKRPWESGLPAPRAFTTYQVVMPPDVWRPAACELVDCPQWRHGWRSTFDERVWCGNQGGMRACRTLRAVPCGRHAAAYIRTEARRTFRERPGPDGLTEFLFEPGQRCFAEHRTRPESWLVWPGDWRGQAGETRRHARAVDWRDDFAEHQQQLSDQAQRG